MTGLESSKLRTYNSISGVFNTYLKKTELIPAMTGIVLEFQSLLSELNLLVIQIGNDSRSYSETRKQKHEILVKKILAVNHAIVVSAQLNNQTILPQFHVSKSRLQLKKESELIAEATNCILEAKHREKQISPAFIQMKAIMELKKTNDEFIEIIAVAKNSAKEKTSLNIEIRLTMKEIDNLLRDKADPLVQLFKQENPSFYEAYRDARRVTHKTYTAKALFSDHIMANTTQTIADIKNQPHNWLLIKNKADTNLSVFLSMIRDIALGEGILIPPQTTIYRQVKHLHPDIRARYLIAKNDDKKINGALEIWMGG